MKSEKEIEEIRQKALTWKERYKKHEGNVFMPIDEVADTILELIDYIDDLRDEIKYWQERGTLKI